MIVVFSFALSATRDWHWHDYTVFIPPSRLFSLSAYVFMPSIYYCTASLMLYSTIFYFVHLRRSKQIRRIAPKMVLFTANTTYGALYHHRKARVACRYSACRIDNERLSTAPYRETVEQKTRVKSEWFPHEGVVYATM